MVLLLLLFGLVYLPVIALRQFRKKRLVASVLVGVIWLFLVGSVFFAAYSMAPGKNIIIARATTLDGVEMCVTHKSNYSVEPYTVSFYYKRPGQPWGGFYYEHEDTRWFRGSIEVNDDGTMAIIKRGRSVVATFDLATDSFTIKRWNRTTKGAQKWMPEGWTPEQAIIP
jgi:hypothetical protein